MEYIGIQSQIHRNNLISVILLVAFPALLLAMVYVFLFFTSDTPREETDLVFLQIFPYVIAGVGCWFLVAWLMNTAIIRLATGSQPLERKANMRVYNILENLCIANGLTMPKLYVIQDTSLNAFASGLNTGNFSITLSSGIIEKLEDAELEGVMAHELSHIRNRDVRVLIISIIFVGIFSFIAEMALGFREEDAAAKTEKAVE